PLGRAGAAKRLSRTVQTSCSQELCGWGYPEEVMSAATATSPMPVPAIPKRQQLAHLTAVLDDLREKGTYFRLRVLEDEQGPVCRYDGREVINLASNNYLGLCNHPKLREAATRAIAELGVGSGAVRTIAGTMRIHMELEEK